MIAGWGLAVAACSAALIFSSGTPGVAAHPPRVLPVSLAGTHAPHRATVVVALHPQCPCSRATVANLESAWQDADPSCDLVALVYTPSDRDASWTQTDTVTRTTALRNARRVEDLDGRLSASLGIATSGQVLVYDNSGSLAFSGGITPSRGHEGDCLPLDVLRSLTGAHTVPGPSVPSASAAVFGCSLCDGEQAAGSDGERP